MDQGQRIGMFASIPPGSMTDSLGIIVHRFNDTVINPHVKVGEDTFFMTSEHPRKLSQRFQTTMSCPPEPPLQIFCCPSSIRVIPELPKQFFEKVSSHNFQLLLQQVLKTDLLLLGQIPGVFQPKVTGSLQNLRIPL